MKSAVQGIEHGIGDEAIMEQLTARDSAAMRELFDRYAPILRKVILGIIHDEVEAEDILQETLLQLWDRAGDYSAENGKPLGWLITIARRRAIDRLRKLQSYRKARDRFETHTQQPNFELHCKPEREIVQEDLRKTLDELLSRLPANQQVAIRMAFYDGMSQREIAAHMEIPLGTIKTRIELGLRKLSTAIRCLDGKI